MSHDTDPLPPNVTRKQHERLWQNSLYPKLISLTFQHNVLSAATRKLKDFTTIYREDDTRNLRANALDVAVHERTTRETTDPLGEQITLLAQTLRDETGVPTDDVLAAAQIDLSYLLDP